MDDSPKKQKIQWITLCAELWRKLKTNRNSKRNEKEKEVQKKQAEKVIM